MTDRQSPTMVRNMDPLLWQQVKKEARRHDLTAGALLNLIINEWVSEHQCAAYGGPLEPIDEDDEPSLFLDRNDGSICDDTGANVGDYRDLEVI